MLAGIEEAGEGREVSVNEVDSERMIGRVHAERVCTLDAQQSSSDPRLLKGCSKVARQFHLSATLPPCHRFSGPAIPTRSDSSFVLYHSVPQHEHSRPRSHSTPPPPSPFHPSLRLCWHSPAEPILAALPRSSRCSGLGGLGLSPAHIILFLSLLFKTGKESLRFRQIYPLYPQESRTLQS